MSNSFGNFWTSSITTIALAFQVYLQSKGSKTLLKALQSFISDQLDTQGLSTIDEANILTEYQKIFSKPDNEARTTALNAWRDIEIKANQEREPLICNVALMGDPGIGKSSLLFKYVDLRHQHTSNYVPTEVIDAYPKRREALSDRARPLLLDFVTCSGHEKDAPALKPHLADKKAILICFDATNRASFEGLGRHITLAKESSPEAQLFLVGTKIDLAHRLPIVSREEASSLAKKHDLRGPFFTDAIYASCWDTQELMQTLVNVLADAPEPAPLKGLGR